MQMIFIDIDNTLLDFDAYIRQTMREGFTHFGLKPYEPYMEAVFHRENGKLWRQIEQGTLTFRELQEIRWNNVFRALNIDFDGWYSKSISARPCTTALSPWTGPWNCWRRSTASIRWRWPATDHTTSSSTGWNWRA